MSILDHAAEILRAANVERPRAEARLLLAHAMGVSQESIVAGSAIAEKEALARFDEMIARRAAHEPFAYIVGRREFWSLSFAVGPGVLIPRPESETHIEQALKRFADPDAALKVLDLGTGAGTLLLAFLSERKNANGVGLDISAEAVAFAKTNARNLGLDARATFFQGSWPDAPAELFDVIFANPPYVASGEIAYLETELAHEPEVALDGGAEGLDAYRAIAPELMTRLSPNAYAFVELGQGQGEEVGEIFAAAGLGIEAFAPDLAGIARSLIVAKPPPAAGNNPKKDMEIAAGSG